MDDVLFCIVNNHHGVTITTHAIKRHFLIWMTTTYETPMFLCFNLKITFICVYWWKRQRIHNTLIVVDWYLRLMGDKTIPDSAEPRLESLYPPFVAGIDLPHQGVVDSYNLYDAVFKRSAGLNTETTKNEARPAKSHLNWSQCQNLSKPLYHHDKQYIKVQQDFHWSINIC